MAERKTVDWEGVEVAYRAGILSIREVGEKYGVSHTLVNRRAKSHKWERDLAPKIKAKADSLVSKAAVSSGVTMETVNSEIEANAHMQASVRLSQRKDISRSRKLVMTLLEELEEQTGNIELYKQLGELLYAPDDKGVDKLNELYHKVISLGGRTGTMKSLAESLKTLVALEREAFGIDEKKAPEGQTVFNMQF